MAAPAPIRWRKNILALAGLMAALAGALITAGILMNNTAALASANAPIAVLGGLATKMMDRD